jgi:hypothetical protein
MRSMQYVIQEEVRRALADGRYARAFAEAEAVLDGMTLREALDRTLEELKDGDVVLYDALAATWISLAQMQGRASLNGVFRLARRFEGNIDPLHRSTAELHEVVEKNPQARFRPQRAEELSAVDRDIVRRRGAADLAMLDAALARGDIDGAWGWTTPTTPLDRLAQLVLLLADHDDPRVGVAGRRLIVRFTIETPPKSGSIAELASAVEQVVRASSDRREQAKAALEEWRQRLHTEASILRGAQWKFSAILRLFQSEKVSRLRAGGDSNSSCPNVAGNRVSRSPTRAEDSSASW